MNKPSRVRMSGPLVAHRRGFTTELMRQGYSPFTAVSVLYLVAHLSRWLERQGLDAGDLTAECVERYLAARRASGQVRRLTPRGLRPLLSYLRGLGVAPPPAAPTAATPCSQLLDAFTDYLRVQRGLAPLTVVGYRRYVRTFLFGRPEEESLEPRRLKPAALSAFMLDQSERRSVGWLNNMATALSALMRFLYVRGDIEPSLVDAVPRAAQRYLAPPKPVLNAADVSRLSSPPHARRAQCVPLSSETIVRGAGCLSRACPDPREPRVGNCPRPPGPFNLLVQKRLFGLDNWDSLLAGVPNGAGPPVSRPVRWVRRGTWKRTR